MAFIFEYINIKDRNYGYSEPTISKKKDEEPLGVFPVINKNLLKLKMFHVMNLASQRKVSFLG